MVIRLKSMTRYDLAGLADCLHVSRGVEIGTYCGYYAYYLLKNTKLEKLHCIDAYEKHCEGYYEEARALLAEFGPRVNLWKIRSLDAAAKFAETGEKFGFVYLDANHRSEVFRDIEAWLPLLDRPAIFAGHDYAYSKRNRVVGAVNNAAVQLGLPVYLTKEVLASWFFILGEES